MQTNRLIPKSYLIAASLMLISVLLTSYGAIANAQRRGTMDATSTVRGEPGERDRDPDYIEKRGKFLNRFFGTGPGGVSPTAYEAGRAMARVLPPSPLLQNKSFRSPEAPEISQLWTLPIAPPIEHSYGGNAGAMVHTLAVDPFNANIVYTGGFGGLAKTTDGGFTWQYLSDAWNSQSVSAIAVDPNASRIVYEGTGREDYGPYSVGLHRSLDGGLSWSRPLSDDHFAGTYVRAIAIDPNASGSELSTTLYVANTSGLWRSTDSGTAFTQMRQGGIYDVAIDASTFPSTLYVTDNTGTFKSTDSGNFWIRIHQVLLNSHNRLSVVKSTSHRRSPTLYLLGPRDPDHNLYKSTDRGVTWVQIPTRCFAEADSCDDPDGLAEHGGNYITAATEAPSNPDVIYAVRNENAVFFTSNAGEGDGAAWIQVTQTGHLHGIHAVSVHPTDPRTAYVACNSGIYKTTDMGTTWVQEGVHDLIYRDVAIDPANPEHIFAVSNAGVFASTDGGLTWGNLSDGIPTGMVVTALSFNGASRQLAASTYGRGLYMLYVGQSVQPHPSPTPRPRP